MKSGEGRITLTRSGNIYISVNGKKTLESEVYDITDDNFPIENGETRQYETYEWTCCGER